MPGKCPCGGTPTTENANHVRTIGDTTVTFCFKRCADDFDESRKQMTLDLERRQEVARATA